MPSLLPPSLALPLSTLNPACARRPVRRSTWRCAASSLAHPPTTPPPRRPVTPAASAVVGLCSRGRRDARRVSGAFTETDHGWAKCSYICSQTQSRSAGEPRALGWMGARWEGEGVNTPHLSESSPAEFAHIPAYDSRFFDPVLHDCAQFTEEGEVACVVCVDGEPTFCLWRSDCPATPHHCHHLLLPSFLPLSPALRPLVAEGGALRSMH